MLYSMNYEELKSYNKVFKIVTLPNIIKNDTDIL